MIVYRISTTATWYVNCLTSEKLSNTPLCDAVNVEQNPKNVVGVGPRGLLEFRFFASIASGLAPVVFLRLSSRVCYGGCGAPQLLAKSKT